jgi:hypothetical protein
MTLPLFLAAHVVYGTVMGFVFSKRMRAEGEVLGLPLVLALVPVALITAPMGALLLRYSGEWFVQGQLGSAYVTFERFHLGLMLGLLLVAHLCVAVSLIFSVALLSRGSPRTALIPSIVAVPLALAAAMIAPGSVWKMAGTEGPYIWQHAAGALSVGVLATFALAIWVGQRHFSHLQEIPS